MSLLVLLVAMAIGMAVYYGVTIPPGSSFLAHVPGHGFGVAVLVIVIIVLTAVQFWPKRDVEEDEEAS